MSDASPSSGLVAGAVLGGAAGLGVIIAAIVTLRWYLQYRREEAAYQHAKPPLPELETAYRHTPLYPPSRASSPGASSVSRSSARPTSPLANELQPPV
ncbi:hypothetical protein M427DRAFT_135393 [Gonapodya prolifera JEL478]|uniref:Uncharacterized protein n=1 Tax=Gonapodya prolifera (strain JEL478) TaxID=1344416 RepID=A0A139AER6_GONPJ|nr:hypothetical protein M427DRAFT_135393 [Gonapodya prolifera JEL478]|eukprot:KXS14925.1 hypothetical protein M427DRAFT_135393 [Gonapodya prolifera JEL478]